MQNSGQSKGLGVDRENRDILFCTLREKAFAIRTTSNVVFKETEIKGMPYLKTLPTKYRIVVLFLSLLFSIEIIN